MTLPAAPFIEARNGRRETFREALVNVATRQIGTKEEGGANCGPKVEEYLRAVRLPKGFPWCAAFVVWCAEKAIPEDDETPFPVPRTGGVLKMWRQSPPECIEVTPLRGRVFILDTGDEGGAGHTGIVEEVHTDGTITTIEGNTNEAGSREGNAVARHRWNPKSGKRGMLLGYLDYAQAIG